MKFELEMTENQARMLIKKFGPHFDVSKQLNAQLPQTNHYSDLLGKHRGSLLPFVERQIGNRVTNDEYNLLINSVDLLEALIEAREFIFEHASGSGLPEGMHEVLRKCIPNNYTRGLIAWHH